MSPIRVLLVDDEPEFLLTLSKRLGRRGLDVTRAEGGEAALARLSEQEFDVVVLDVKMPGVDGIEVLKTMRARGLDAAVIMLTGHADVEAAVQGLTLGAFDYLMKPMALDDLVYKIEDAHRTRTLGNQPAPTA